MSAANAHLWYVALAAPHLLRWGFEPYLPSYLKQRRRARCTDVVAAPLFPRHVFFSADLTLQRWRAIHSTTGVARLLCNGEGPTRVADAIIDGSRASQDERKLPFAWHLVGVPSHAVGVIEGGNRVVLGPL